VADSFPHARDYTTNPGALQIKKLPVVRREGGKERKGIQQGIIQRLCY
jgi:hypothetical protein